jgi:hypothetical protein
LLAPSAITAPYNKSLNTMAVRQRRDWASKVIRQMEVDLPMAEEVIVLAGTRYRENLMAWLQGRFARVSVPMEGLPIGRQLNWLSLYAGFWVTPSAVSHRSCGGITGRSKPTLACERASMEKPRGPETLKLGTDFAIDDLVGCHGSERRRQRRPTVSDHNVVIFQAGDRANRR